MKSLSAEQLLLVWEQVHGFSLLHKTLLLLEMLQPESEQTDIAELSIGDRDTRLLRFRNSIFGSSLHNTINCPECSSKMEWDMDLQDFIVHPSANHQALPEHELFVDDFKVRFRLPNSRDILWILSKKGEELKSYSLLEQCVLDIKQAKGKKKINSIPERVIDALGEKIQELDPAADIRMNITCPSCGFQWQATFDIMSYLWAEIDNWAHKTLQEVYILASSFGWSEKDILNMDASRRQYYIEMIRS